MSLKEELKTLASVDLFKEVAHPDAFVGRPFYFDYEKIKLVANDAWKNKVCGVPAGAFLAAVYDNAEDNPEVVLLRVLGPSSLPSDPDVVAAMVEHYKENAPTAPADQKLDSYTRYQFQFSGLECRVLGSFFKGPDGSIAFGADIDNFFCPTNYSVYKLAGRVLEFVVNFREGRTIPGGKGDQRIGEVRYSSSRRHTESEKVPTYVSAFDYIGQRTALFGMTRTGKSNTVKKIIQATMDLSREMDDDDRRPFGQIVFDVNGEYANDNQQDEGTAIYQLYRDDVTRYSIMEKGPDFKVMKLNFYESLREGIELIRAGLADDKTIYTRAFLNIDWQEPDPEDRGQQCRYDRLIACYKCVLYAAGYRPRTSRVSFPGQEAIDSKIKIKPKDGITLDEATQWFEWVWENYETDSVFADYKKKRGRDWANGDLQTLMRFLTRRPEPGHKQSEAGFRKLVPFRELHTNTTDESFEREIVGRLRNGEIVIVDLSQGDPRVQRTMSDRVCDAIFKDAMRRFISNEPANVIQMYFEEAHNLFPKKTDADLQNIYNRIAKEGAKLRLGLIYATQEVSSISSNVLKNTQNWFVSHLNNDDELREIGKFYDFKDFVSSLRRTTDKGFIRMKTYSNAFVVPVQIDRFTV